jgi:hypothetical protein
MFLFRNIFFLFYIKSRYSNIHEISVRNEHEICLVDNKQVHNNKINNYYKNIYRRHLYMRIFTEKSYRKNMAILSKINEIYTN